MFYEFSDVSCPGCIFFAALSYLEYVQHLWFHVLVLHRDLFGYHFSPPAGVSPFHVLVIQTHISTDTALIRGSWSDFIGKSRKWGGRGYFYWNLPFWILIPGTETSEALVRLKYNLWVRDGEQSSPVKPKHSDNVRVSPFMWVRKQGKSVGC